MYTTPNSVSLQPEEILRYSRHFALPQVGLLGQEKLKAARILCVGAGGLGAPLLLYLAAAGIGTLGVIDDDQVELSNLQRQILYSTADLNQKKVTVVKNKLKQLNPNINIITYDKRLTKENALQIIDNYDVIADGTDNFATRYLVNDACFHLKKPNVYASIFQFEGQCSVFDAEKGPCYRCLYDAPPPAGLIPNCAEGGVLGVLPGILGSIQATEVIKLILGKGQPLIGRLLIVDALDMRFQEVVLAINPNCRLCSHHQSFASLPLYEESACEHKIFSKLAGVGQQQDVLPQGTDILISVDEEASTDGTPLMPTTVEFPKESIEEVSVQELYALRQEHADFTLLDVREVYEYAICNLGGYLIPLSQLPNRLNELDKHKLCIVHCKAGPRSLQAALLLKQAGFNVKQLTGGILAWAQEVDNSLLIY